MTHNTRAIEEVVAEFDHTFFDSEYYEGAKTGAKFCGCYEGDIGNVFDHTRKQVLDWLRTTLHAQNQAADERLREVVGEVIDCIPQIDIRGAYDADMKTLIDDIKNIAAKHGITDKK